MGNKKALGELLQANLGDQIQSIEFSHGLHTVEILPDKIISVCEHLRDDPALRFEMLIDVCGVDYLYYGMTDWETEDATNTGYSRGVEPPTPTRLRWQKSRFAAVYHLLSITHNHRVRLRVLLDEIKPRVPSVTSLWASANWFEREAFDLFGIFFDDHPDLRRLLTDYGFDGHPFRKDFPVVGRTQVRYSAQDGRVIQEPVTIPDRELVPKVIRQDNRYWETK